MSLAKHVSIFFKADTKGFQNGLDKMSKKMTRFGRQTQKLGRSITRNFSVPFAIAGGAAVKMAADFDTSLTKMRTLVGLSEQQVNQFKESVLELSGKTAQAPKELADGLYFLTSAGLEGANAMETLEQVSKGVAIGLGEQTDLAKVAGAAQNAYGKEVLSASDALDVFGAMVKTGMFESAELAKVLGKEAGFAATLGISFEELGAFISTYTRTTGDATSATVGVSGVMMAFTKQTDKGEKALAGINMTYGSLKQMLGEQGLQKTLIHLKNRFAEENIELSEFFSKSQSLKGVLNVLGNQTGEYIDILDDLKKSTGFVNDGFEIVEGTVGFKLTKAFNEFKLAMMDLGVALLPVANKLIDFVTKLADKFRSLSPAAKESIATLSAGFAATGPLMIGLGLVLSSIGKIQKALLLLARNPYMAALGLAITGVVSAIGGLRGMFVKTQDSLKDVGTEVNKTIGKFDALVSVASDETLALDARKKALNELNKSVTTFNGGLDTQNINLADSKKLLEQEREQLIANAMVKAGQAKLSELFAKRLEVEAKNIQKYSANLLSPGFMQETGSELGGTLTPAYIAKQKELKQLDEETRKIEKLISKYSSLLDIKVGKSTTTTTTGGGDGDGGGGDGAIATIDAITNYLESEFIEVSDLCGFFPTIQENLMEVEETFKGVFTDMSKHSEELALNVAKNISTGIGDAFAAAVVDGKSFGESMREMFNQILQQIIAITIQTAILNAILESLGLGGQSSKGGSSIIGTGLNFFSSLFGGGNQVNDIAFGPSAGRFITGPEGTFSLNPNDSIVAGTNLFGGGQGSKNMTVNGYIDGSSIFLSNTRQTNTVNRLS